MISVSILSLAAGAEFASADGAAVGRGAIAGGILVAAALLAGFSVIRRNGAAVCAAILLVAAGVLEFSWLGFFGPVGGDLSLLFQAFFAAAAIIFVSSSLGAARNNALLGGVLFTGALILGGLGVLNLFARIDVSALLRYGFFAVGGMVLLISAIQSVRGDAAARLILPGALLVAIAPFVGTLGAPSVFAFAPHALFALGVISASLVALLEPVASVSPARVIASRDAVHSLPDHVYARHHSSSPKQSVDRERVEIILDSQLARVLDYSGVAVWDWTEQDADQTELLSELLGADSNSVFTPEAMRNFIHAQSIDVFEKNVLAAEDGPFDVTLKLFDGRVIRMRGARAVDGVGDKLERVVAFVERAAQSHDAAAANDDVVRSATAAAVVPTVARFRQGEIERAFENGEITAAFQPVVNLKTRKTEGYEALARWRRADGEDDLAEPVSLVRDIEAVGKGGALAAEMLDQAGAFLSDTLKDRGKNAASFVTMNVSWAQARDPLFVDALKSVIKKYGLPKSSLVIELTESEAIRDVDEGRAVFTALKDAGAALAFDDFGAGFSCLANLRAFDFDYLKIDKSFTAEILSNADSRKIVAALASLGKDLGLSVIVEGVESDKIADVAYAAGCTFGQGYALGRPAYSEKALRKDDGNSSITEPGRKGEVTAKLETADGGDDEPSDDRSAISEPAGDEPESVFGDENNGNDAIDADFAAAAAAQQERRSTRWLRWRGGGVR